MFRDIGGQPFNELASVGSVKLQSYPAIIIISRGGGLPRMWRKGTRAPVNVYSCC